MSFVNKLMGAGMTALLSLGVAAFAQQPQGPPIDRSNRPDRMGRSGGPEGRDKMRGRERHGMRGALRELNLTDAQKEQVRAAVQRNMEGTKAQREELRQLAEKRRQGTLTPEEQARTRSLHEEISNSMKNSHSDLFAILTPEQKTRLEEIKKERKTRHREMRERRQDRGDRQSPPANIP
ncbi:MAG TPA: Spy/CpxP family protein refolding chaperone [Pyrinomonadaceae bacterium]